MLPSTILHRCSTFRYSCFMPSMHLVKCLILANLSRNLYVWLYSSDFFVVVVVYLPNYAFLQVLHVFFPDHFAHLVCLS